MELIESSNVELKELYVADIKKEVEDAIRQ